MKVMYSSADWTAGSCDQLLQNFEADKKYFYKLKEPSSFRASKCKKMQKQKQMCAWLATSHAD